MRNMFINYMLACTVIGGSSALGAEISQMVITDVPQHLMRPNAFMLYNSASETDIFFYLGAEENKLTEHQLIRNSVQEFSDGESNQYVINIPTSGRDSISYILKAGKRYKIYWNPKDNRWDLVELTSQ